MLGLGMKQKTFNQYKRFIYKNKMKSVETACVRAQQVLLGISFEFIISL